MTNTAPQPITSEQRLTIENYSLRLEILQLKANQLQREFDAQTAALAQYMNTVSVEGYDLNTALEFVKRPEQNAE